MHKIGRERQLSQRGFTLLEVLVAAMILIVAIVGSIALIIGLLRGNQTTRARDTAYFLAQETLDQLASTPISLYPTLPQFGGTMANPTAPTCYGEGDDAFIDHPIPCYGPAAYYVRSWICCATPAAGGLWQLPNPPPANAINPCSTSIPWEAQYNTIATPSVASQLTIPATAATCVVATEVTWPTEPTGTSASATNLFNDTSSTAPILNFQNHVFETMVRSQ